MRSVRLTRYLNTREKKRKWINSLSYLINNAVPKIHIPHQLSCTIKWNRRWERWWGRDRRRKVKFLRIIARDWEKWKHFHQEERPMVTDDHLRTPCTCLRTVFSCFFGHCWWSVVCWFRFVRDQKISLRRWHASRVSFYHFNKKKG